MTIEEATVEDVNKMRDEVIKCRNEALSVDNINPERCVTLSHLIQFLWCIIDENEKKALENAK